MKTVHKFQLAQRGFPTTLFFPAGAQVLRVDIQCGVPYVWVFMDDSMPKMQRHDFLLVGTFEVVPDEYWPINTLSGGLERGAELHAFARMPLAGGYSSYIPTGVASV